MQHLQFQILGNNPASQFPCCQSLDHLQRFSWSVGNEGGGRGVGYETGEGSHARLGPWNHKNLRHLVQGTPRTK